MLLNRKGDGKLKGQGISCEVKPLRCYFKCILGAGRGGSAVGIKENLVLAFCKSFVLFENCVEVNYIKQGSSSHVENSCLK